MAKSCAATSVQALLGIAALAATGGFNGLFFAHMAAYLTGVLHYDPRQAITSQTIGVVVHALSILAVGRLADRISPRILIRIGTIALMVLAFPFYNAIEARSLHPTVLLTLAGLCAGLVNGSFACILTDLFPTRVRFTGVALVVQRGLHALQRLDAAGGHEPDSERPVRSRLRPLS